MMSVLFVCFAVVFVGSLHPASGLTTTTPMDSTTDFLSRPDVQEVIHFYQNSSASFISCIDQTTKDVCTKEITGLKADREGFCRTLQAYSMCMDKCSQALKDRTNKALKDFSCGGCGFLQGSLLLLMLVPLLQYFV